MTLRAAAGPGIELLEYLAPRDGRPYPAEAKANDLFHWQTRLVSRDVDANTKLLREAHARLVSSGMVTLDNARIGFTRGVLVRDPGGHWVLLFEALSNAKSAIKVYCEVAEG